MVGTKVEYKMLAGPALLPLVAKMSKQGEPLPNLALMVAFVAVDEQGEIVSHCVLQNLPFLEPTHSDTGFSEHLQPLVEMMKEWVIKSGAARVIVRTSENCLLNDMVEKEGKRIRELPGNSFDWRRDGHV